MIIPLPIGLWVFSLVSDIIFKAGWGGPIWKDVAFYTMAGGIIGALLAAVPGLLDLISLENPQTKKVAIWHMILNLVVVVLYAVNLWVRSRPGVADNTGPDTGPFILSIIGILIMCVSGWLGGELVYVRRVGIDPKI